MTRGRCQICGRLRPLRAAGTMVHHQVKGLPCAGKGQPPLDVDDGFLAAEAARHENAWLNAVATIRALEARRANYIDPAIVAVKDRSFDEYLRLDRRLRRHRAWPDRYRRQMERDGMALPPPAYLIERERAAGRIV